MKSFAATLIASTASAGYYSTGYSGAYSGSLGSSLSGRRVLGLSGLSGATSSLTLGGSASGLRLSGLSGGLSSAGGLRLTSSGGLNLTNGIWSVNLPLLGRTAQRVTKGNATGSSKKCSFNEVLLSTYINDWDPN